MSMEVNYVNLNMDRVCTALQIVLHHVMIPDLGWDFESLESRHIDIKKKSIDMIFDVLQNSKSYQQTHNQGKAMSTEELTIQAEEKFQNLNSGFEDSLLEWHEIVMRDFHVHELMESVNPIEFIPHKTEILGVHGSISDEELHNSQYFSLKTVADLINPWLSKYWLPVGLSVQHRLIEIACKLRDSHKTNHFTMASFFQKQRKRYSEHAYNILVYELVGCMTWKDRMSVLENIIYQLSNIVRILEEVATVHVLRTIWLQDRFGQYVWEGNYVSQRMALNCLFQLPNFFETKIIGKALVAWEMIFLAEYDQDQPMLETTYEDNKVNTLHTQQLDTFKKKWKQLQTFIINRWWLAHQTDHFARLFIDLPSFRNQLEHEHQQTSLKELESVFKRHCRYYYITSRRNSQEAACHEWILKFLWLKHRYLATLWHVTEFPDNIIMEPIKDDFYEDTACVEDRKARFLLVLQNVLELIEETLQLLQEAHMAFHLYPLNRYLENTLMAKQDVVDFLVSEYASAVHYYVIGCIEAESVEVRSTGIHIEDDALLQGRGDGWELQRNNIQFKEERFSFCSEVLRLYREHQAEATQQREISLMQETNEEVTAVVEIQVCDMDDFPLLSQYSSTMTAAFVCFQDKRYHRFRNKLIQWYSKAVYLVDDCDESCQMLGQNNRFGLDLGKKAVQCLLNAWQLMNWNCVDVCELTDKDKKEMQMHLFMIRFCDLMDRQYHHWWEDCCSVTRELRDDCKAYVTLAETSYERCLQYFRILYSSIEMVESKRKVYEMFLKAEKCKIWLLTVGIRTQTIVDADKFHRARVECGIDKEPLCAVYDDDAIKIWKILKEPLDKIIETMGGAVDLQSCADSVIEVDDGRAYLLFWFEKTLECLLLKFEAIDFLSATISNSFSPEEVKAIVGMVEDIFQPWIDWFTSKCEEVVTGKVSNSGRDDKEKADKAAISITTEVFTKVKT